MGKQPSSTPTPQHPAASGFIRFKLTIAYDGTGYEGWQLQKTGTGVQEKVEAALARLFPSRPQVFGSSRTDTGVHAFGMVAHFDAPLAECRLNGSRLLIAINAHLPADIRVLAAHRTRPDFHARFDAMGKQYRYLLWNHPAMNPLLRSQAWHCKRRLDVKAMRAAAKYFPGKHDFRSFRTNPSYDTDSTVRTITRCDVRKSGALYTFILEGDGFLYRMCRGIVGTLVQVGEGKLAAADIPKILASRDRRVAGMTAPAHGLVLWKVFYSQTPNSKFQVPKKLQSSKPK